jgi:XTP/dITP diphosphohydrolase
MKHLLIATSNKGKFREFSDLLGSLVDQVFSLEDFPDLLLPEENGTTFRENAIIKSRHAATVTGLPVIADDSGLEVVILGGRPGVYSARFAGEDARDEDNNRKLLEEMAGIPLKDRTARFVCCIALSLPDGTCQTFEGVLSGLILEQPRGKNGFGYDPLFLVREYGKSMAELDLSVKNRISHRACALRNCLDYLAVSG